MSVSFSVSHSVYSKIIYFTQKVNSISFLLYRYHFLRQKSTTNLPIKLQLKNSWMPGTMYSFSVYFLFILMITVVHAFSREFTGCRKSRPWMLKRVRLTFSASRSKSDFTPKISPWQRRLKMQQTPFVVPFLVPARAHSELFVALMGLRPPFPCSLSLERLHDDDFSSKNGTPFAFLSVVQCLPCASISIHRFHD